MFDAVNACVRDYGIDVYWHPWDQSTTAVFDGVSTGLNPAVDMAACTYYLAHSFGSIVIWSVDFDGTKRLFQTLREARELRHAAPALFEAALAEFRRFEMRASELGVALLDAAGHGHERRQYSDFCRADLEAITIFHRSGTLPLWSEFFERWKQTAGPDDHRPLDAANIPNFVPKKIERQEVKRGVGGQFSVPQSVS